MQFEGRHDQRQHADAKQAQDSLMNANQVSAGIYLGPGSENDVVESNIVDGSGHSAIVISGYPAENNVIRNNAK